MLRRIVGTFSHCKRRRMLGFLIATFAAGLCVSYIIDYIIFENGVCYCSGMSKPGRRKHTVKLAMTIIPIGRLGNIMGEYATLFGLSRLNGYQPVLMPKMNILRKYFSLSIPTLGKHVEEKIHWEEHWLKDWMEPSYGQFTDTFVKLLGHPCSWTFYHDFREEILREFTFLPSIVQDVQHFLHEAKGSRNTTITFIGVHVRRGDYVNLMIELYDGVLADRNYLSAAMEEYRSRYSDTLFIVSSDDLLWCRKNINREKGDVIFAWNGWSRKPGVDMALLSQCNHSIMTIGTFGYWSSYLTGGDVIYLSNFTRPHSKFNAVFRPNARFLPHWKGIPADLNSMNWL